MSMPQAGREASEISISYPALNLFGPLLIGAFLNTILYGVCAVQCFIYYRTYESDSKWIRYLVLYLFIMETCNTVFDIGVVFEPLVLHYGDPKSFTVAPTMLILDAVTTVMISTPVQYFLAWRIKVLSESIVMPLIIIFFGTCALVGGCTLSVAVAFVQEWAAFKRFDGAVITWFGATAAADLLITISLCWSLNRVKVAFKSTGDDKVSRIIRLTIQTGLITTIFAVLDVVVALTVKGKALNFAWDLALSKLYTNSLLSTLNARDGGRNIVSPGPSSQTLSERIDSGTKTEASTFIFRKSTDLSSIRKPAFEPISAADTLVHEAHHDIEWGSLETRTNVRKNINRF